MTSRIMKFNRQRRLGFALAVVGFILFLASCLLWGLAGVLIGFIVMGILGGIAIMLEWASFDHLVCPRCGHHLLGERGEDFLRVKDALLKDIDDGRLVRCDHCGIYVGTQIKIRPQSVYKIPPPPPISQKQR